ncbi:MAG: hypothetical protein U9R54_01995 [Bacteroidota bacterium]|nr:hypothetical protein [Bacteroidota bacterium]
MTGLKKITSYILIAVILVSTIVAILGIWDIICLEDVIRKILTSLFVVFVALVVVLFIFTVLIKENDKE